MPASNSVPTINPPDSDAQATACSTSCQSCGSGLLRAMVYTPVVLIVGAMGAVAMFPDLAEYAAPLVSCSSGGCSSQRSAHASLMGLDGSAPAGGCSSSEISSGGCCPMSGGARFETISAEADPAEETATTAEPDLAALAPTDVPADATSASNLTEVETASN
jgi:hypothetical protein